MIWYPFFNSFIFRELVIECEPRNRSWKCLCGKCLTVENVWWCNLLLWVSGSFCINLIYIFLFEQCFNTLFFNFSCSGCHKLIESQGYEAGNVLWQKMFAVWKMPHGWKCLVLQPRDGKLLAPKNVTVQIISRCGKFLMVENIWWSKKLPPFSEDCLDSNLINHYLLFHVKKYPNKVHE